ncbi:MAG: hypothetical protein PHN66_03630 [Candidatus Shapirobacteria bacterium]|nr:hypothetical protein [Candidatus Shapirobacteria bacterium]
MMEFFKKYFVLFFLGFLVIVLILLKIFFGNTKTNEIDNKIITPTPSQAIIPTISEYQSDDPESERNETTVLPYRGKKMEIAGYLKPGVLVILIEKEEDKAEAEAEFKEWLEKNPIFKTNSFEFQISKIK